MMQKVIARVMEKMDPVICDGIEQKAIPEILESYHKMLQRRYSEIDVRLKLHDYEKIFKIICDMEYREWSKLSPNMKKSLLIFDLALNKIIDISNTGSGHAVDRIEKGILISAEYADEKIREMKSHEADVREENRIVAQNYISEGTVDFMYASGRTEYMSFRNGRYYRSR